MKRRRRREAKSEKMKEEKRNEVEEEEEEEAEEAQEKEEKVRRGGEEGVGMGRRGRKEGNNFTEDEKFFIQLLHSLKIMPRMVLKKKRKTGRG